MLSSQPTRFGVSHTSKQMTGVSRCQPRRERPARTRTVRVTLASSASGGGNTSNQLVQASRVSWSVVSARGAGSTSGGLSVGGILACSGAVACCSRCPRANAIQARPSLRSAGCSTNGDIMQTGSPHCVQYPVIPTLGP